MSSDILQFQPQLLPTLVAVGLILLFVALGFWQLERAAEKRSLAETLSNRIDAPAIALSTLLQPANELRYRTIKARGRLLQEKTVYIENRKHQGRNGFHVITPLRIDGEQRQLLVNRGWVAARGQNLPPEIATPTAELSVTGRVDVPSAPALELQFQAGETTRIWPYLTLKHYTVWSGLELYPFILLQTDDDDAGFVREWPRPATEDGMHIGYAIQWFAFAAIVLAIWGKLSLVRQRPGSNA
ncbi:MAG: SURF1 family protein [Gammaproteobacteria bacterium]|nr:SURF1 family protein [Gammaproteobacteria bacterium]